MFVGTKVNFNYAGLKRYMRFLYPCSKAAIRSNHND